MTLDTNKLSVAVDFESGVITSLTIGGKERLAEESVLFRIQLSDAKGNRTLYTSRDAAVCAQTECGAVYSGFGSADVSVEVWLTEENGEAAWKIGAMPKNDTYFVECVEFPSITLPKLIENNPECGGKILFPYNEGVLVSNMDTREESMFHYREPVYPSKGSYAMFPNMVCSQMLAYLWEDAGLYIGTHDEKRSVKDINFIGTEKRSYSSLQALYRCRFRRKLRYRLSYNFCRYGRKMGIGGRALSQVV